MRGAFSSETQKQHGCLNIAMTISCLRFGAVAAKWWETSNRAYLECSISTTGRATGFRSAPHRSKGTTRIQHNKRCNVLFVLKFFCEHALQVYFKERIVGRAKYGLNMITCTVLETRTEDKGGRYLKLLILRMRILSGKVGPIPAYTENGRVFSSQQTLGHQWT